VRKRRLGKVEATACAPKSWMRILAELDELWGKNSAYEAYRAVFLVFIGRSAETVKNRCLFKRV
jgi:hypothetical protein